MSEDSSQEGFISRVKFHNECVKIVGEDHTKFRTTGELNNMSARSHLFARFAIFAIFVIASLAFTPELQACPTCKSGMADGSHSGLQEGFYWSILFMMSMPFFIIGGLSTMFYFSVRKAKRQPGYTGLALPASE